MKLAILGAEAVPHGDSRADIAARELARRLVGRGHAVTVYARAGAGSRGIRAIHGARIVGLPLPGGVDPSVLVGAQALHAAVVLRPDAALMFCDEGAGGCLVARATDLPAVVDLAALEGRSGRLPRALRAYLRSAHRRTPADAGLAVAGSQSSARALAIEGGHAVEVVSHGVEDPGWAGRRTLARLGLASRDYVLTLGADGTADGRVVEAFLGLPGEHGLKLVVAGPTPDRDPLVRELLARRDPRLVLPGRVSDRGRWELLRDAFAFFAPPATGGSDAALLAALAAGTCAIVSDDAPTRAVVGDAAIALAPDAPATALRAALQSLLDSPERAEALRAAARVRAQRFSWDAVTDAYERLLLEVVQARSHGALPSAVLEPGAPPPVLPRREPGDGRVSSSAA